MLELFKRSLRTSTVIVFAAGVILGGCSEARLAAHALKNISPHGRVASRGPSKVFKVGKPYQISGRWYEPQINMGYAKVGVASWYGPNFHGKYTANGEVYNKYDFTAAHKTLPLPTIVRVSNLENGRSIKVRINDRGPFVGDRIIDLSYGAAREIGMMKKGLARVKVEVLQEETLALYKTLKNPPTYAALFPKPAPRPYRVSRHYQPQPRPVQQAAVQRVNFSVTPSRHFQAHKSVQKYNGNPFGDEYNKKIYSDQLFIQAGSFSSLENATHMERWLKTRHPSELVTVQNVIVKGQPYYRVRLGPLRDQNYAHQLLAHVVQSGQAQAKIVSD